MTAPPHSLEVHHTLAVNGSAGSLPLSFDARFSAAWTVLFGPSGCGKSTLLRAMCGFGRGLNIRFLRTDGGEGGLVLEGEGVWLPAQKRRLGYAPQNAGLFPHLSVAENVGFGVRVRARMPGSPALVEAALDLLRLGDLRNRLPRELSGGERQRVSLARALAIPDICLLLLDEPFAGIDRALRDQLLPGIQQWVERHRVPVISVTHDVDEVFLLGAEVVRLHDGRIAAQGRPAEVLADEAERVQQALQRRP